MYFVVCKFKISDNTSLNFIKTVAILAVWCIGQIITCSSKSNNDGKPDAINTRSYSESDGEFISEDLTEWGAGDPEQQMKGGCDVPILPNVGYAFRGYNILRANPFHADTEGDPGFSLPIFQASHYGRKNVDESYRLPDGIHGYKKQICKVDTETKQITNEKTYQEDLLKQLGGGLGGGIFSALLPISFSANTAYQRTRYKISKEHHLFVKTENQCSVFELQLDKNKPPKFTDGFLIASKRLEDIEDNHAYSDFVKDYGTHFLETTHMGARYAIETEFTQQSRNELYRDRFDIKMAAGINFKISFGLNVERGTNKEIIEQYQELQESHSILSYGAPIPRDGKGVTWANQVFKNPLPIDYKLAKIQDLFTKRFMTGSQIRNTISTGLDYKKINKGLTSFLQNYCELEKENIGISKYEISCKGPDGGCDGGHDCHHNAECSNIYQGGSERTYQCTCREGYKGDGKVCSGWDVGKTVLENGRYSMYEQEKVWGEWYKEEVCAKNTYAYAIALKVELIQRGGFLGTGKDNSGLNGVKLYCKNPNTKRLQGDVTSGIGWLGSWTKKRKCSREEDFLIGYRFKAKEYKHGDKVFGVDIDVYCQNGYEINGKDFPIENGERGVWGDWSSTAACPDGSAICGIKTRISPKGRRDDVGLTDIKLICCQF